MPRFLRRDGKLLRRNGRLARSGCRSECCDTTARYVKFSQCCDSLITLWIVTTTVCNGPITGPMLLIVPAGGAVPGGCYRNDPSVRKTRDEILAMGVPAARILEGVPANVRCHVDGSCSHPDCPDCPGCCSEGAILLCVPQMGMPRSSRCCNCGGDFRLYFRANFNYSRSLKIISSGSVCQGSGCVHPCTGAGGSWCQNSISALAPFLTVNARREFVYDFRCNQGFWEIECVGHTFTSTETAIDYMTEPWMIDPSLCQGPPSGCDGWSPRVADTRVNTVNESCTNHPTFDPVLACSLDYQSAVAVSGMEIPGPYAVVPAGWQDVRNALCEGSLQTGEGGASGTCVGMGGCSGQWTLNPSQAWQWEQDVGCRHGHIYDSFTMTDTQAGGPFGGAPITGYTTRDIFWQVTRYGPCPPDMIQCPNEGVINPHPPPIQYPKFFTLEPVMKKGPAVLRIRSTKDLF